MRRHKHIIIGAVLAATGGGAASAVAQTNLYVDAARAGTAGLTGLDWSHAYSDLQDALSYARAHSSVNSIRVARGSYAPGALASSTFLMVPGVTVYGGYPTGGAATADPIANPTILSGLVNPLVGLHAYHVVTCDGGMFVNGFTISDGRAVSYPADSQGGGVLIKSGWGRLVNSIVENNSALGGGGIAAWPDARLWLYNDTIRNNSSSSMGGGILISSADTGNAMTRVLLESNSSTSGGAVYLLGNLYAESCLFRANSASVAGAFYMAPTQAATATLTNCTLVNNSASSNCGAVYGGAISAGTTYLLNSILAGNTAPSYAHGAGDLWTANSDVYVTAGLGGTKTGCIDADPKFVSASDFRLKATSPCVDAGLNASVRYSEDLDGNTRIMRSVLPAGVLQVDLGCYERSPLPPVIGP